MSFTHRKIQIPPAMLKAAGASTNGVDPEGYLIYCMLEAALRWLAENPIVPTEQQAYDIAMQKSQFQFDPWELVRWGAVEWQRRMFLAPEPPAPTPLVCFIMHHFEDVELSSQTRRIRAEAAVRDYEESQKRSL